MLATIASWFRRRTPQVRSTAEVSPIVELECDDGVDLDEPEEEETLPPERAENLAEASSEEGDDEPVLVDLSAPDVALAVRRREAMAMGLAGENRIYLSDPGGPGSLAEALNRLAEQGRVKASFVDDPSEDPYLLYVPTSNSR